MSNDKRVTIRIPADLHALIVKASAHDTRSINGEIIALLQKAVADRK
jgi:hypothetical protein